MKHFSLFIALVAALLLGACTNKPAAKQGNEIPEEITSFIEQNFADQTIVNVEREKTSAGFTFETVLSNGTTVEFDAKNVWEKVEGFNNPLPASIVPAPIMSHAEATFPGNPIVEIDKELYGFDVRLANGMELVYDRQGKFKKIDN